MGLYGCVFPPHIYRGGTNITTTNYNYNFSTPSWSGFNWCMGLMGGSMALGALTNTTVSLVNLFRKQPTQEYLPVQQQAVTANTSTTKSNLEKIYKGYTWIEQDGEIQGFKDGKRVAHGKTFEDIVSQMDGDGTPTVRTEAHNQDVRDTNQAAAISKLTTDLGVQLGDAKDDDYATFKYNGKTITVTPEGKYKVDDNECIPFDKLKETLGINDESPASSVADDGNDNEPVIEQSDNNVVNQTSGEINSVDDIKYGITLSVHDKGNNGHPVTGTVSDKTETGFTITTNKGNRYEFAIVKDGGKTYIVNTKVNSNDTDKQRYQIQNGRVEQDNTIDPTGCGHGIIFGNDARMKGRITYSTKVDGYYIKHNGSTKLYFNKDNQQITQQEYEAAENKT